MNDPPQAARTPVYGSQRPASTEALQVPSTQLSVPQQNINTPRSYTNAVKSTPQVTFPKREQAVIMNVVDNLKLGDYVIALGNIVDPKNILFASRIANNRICIYLSSTNLVDKLLAEHQSVEIDNMHIGIRRLITPAKRLIVSNVCPSIPHEFVENGIKSLGLSLMSPITFLKAAIQGDRYGHVLSFRRQVYVSPPQNEDYQLPSTILVNHDDTDYRIFLSFDEMTCFLCRKNGHIAKNCPDTANRSELDAEQTDKPAERELTQLTPNNTQKKRPLAPSTISSEHEDETIASQSQETDPAIQVNTFTAPVNKSKSKNQSKKLKKSLSTEGKTIEVLLEPAKSMIQSNIRKYVLPFDVLVNFLENTQNSDDPLNEAKKYTPDVETLVKMLYDVYPYLTEKSIKKKFTAISRKLRQQIREEKLETSSNFSTLSIDVTDNDSQNSEDETH